MGNNVIQKLNASIISMLPVYCRILSFTGLLIGTKSGRNFLKKKKQEYQRPYITLGICTINSLVFWSSS